MQKMEKIYIFKSTNKYARLRKVEKKIHDYHILSYLIIVHI